MDKQTDLISRLQDEADLCRNDGASDIAALLDEAAAALAAERERLAKTCIERAQLSWAAADQPHASEVKMQHEAAAAAMEELAGELRA